MDEIRNIIKEKVVGKWVAAHNEKGHHYKEIVSGIVVDSVTQQLAVLNKPHILPWAIGQALEYFIENRDWYDFTKDKEDEQNKKIIHNAKFAYTAVRDDAGNVGTIAHDYINTWINTWIETGERIPDIRLIIDPKEDGRVFAAARSGAEIFDKYSAVPVWSELLVGWLPFFSAGTLDLLVQNEKGELELWDWKTSNSIDKVGYPIQVAAYKLMFEKMTELKIKRCKIMKLSKDYSHVEVYCVTDVPGSTSNFKRLARVYRWIHSEKEKVLKDKKRITL